MRYANGELSVVADDLRDGGFGLPWGHTRSFASRLERFDSDYVGNGYNWLVAQWPYLLADPAGTVVVQGTPNTAYYFDTVDGRFVPRFQVKQSLEFDGTAHLYRLFDLDGTITEFDDFTGGFRRGRPSGPARVGE